DDWIVYNMQGWYRVVVNCSTREKDLAWMQQIVQKSGAQVELHERDDLAMIAIQGPQAIALTTQVLTAGRGSLLDSLKTFYGVTSDTWFIARTGYTGEEGLEIMLPSEEAAALWQSLAKAGVAPCGLGARDTLRLEAGMNLY